MKPKIYEVELKKLKIEDIEDWRTRRIEEVEELKKLKIEEVEVIWSQRFKIWSLETQPESATQVESRGLLTWVCPSGTRRLVYQVQPIMEVDKYKDSKIDLETKKVLIRIRLGHL
jgi:hypothetical protein